MAIVDLILLLGGLTLSYFVIKYFLVPLCKVIFAPWIKVAEIKQRKRVAEATLEEARIYAEIQNIELNKDEIAKQTMDALLNQYNDNKNKKGMV